MMDFAAHALHVAMHEQMAQERHSQLVASRGSLGSLQLELKWLKHKLENQNQLEPCEEIKNREYQALLYSTSGDAGPLWGRTTAVEVICLAEEYQIFQVFEEYLKCLA